MSFDLPTAKVEYLAPEKVSTIGIVGTGSVGASWTTLFLAHGLNVVAYDPAAGSADRTRTFVRDAWPSLMDLKGTPKRKIPEHLLQFVSTLEAVALGSEVIQENVPERADVKALVISTLDAHASPEKILLSSTGGIPPTVLQQSCKRPERFVVVHPFNPTHLVPLVEVVGGQRTSPEVVSWAMAFSRNVGKHPIRLKREAPGHMTNRLQFALLREAVHCLIEDVASPSDIDAAIRYGLGPRWALMGSLLTLHLAGGAGGMQGILNHAGDAIETWWDALGQPHLGPDVREKLVEAAQEVALGHSIDEWVNWRDHNLTKVLKLMNRDPEPKPVA